MRSLEESFVVLTGRGGAGGGGSGGTALSLAEPQQGLDDLFAACARTFEMASTATQVHEHWVWTSPVRRGGGEAATSCCMHMLVQAVVGATFLKQNRLQIGRWTSRCAWSAQGR